MRIAGLVNASFGALFGLLLTTSLTPPAPPAPPAPGPVLLTAGAVPTPAHVVVVIEENRSQANVIGNPAAPFINQLAAGGAMMSQSFAEVHPSEPNYFALFAGSTLGLTKNVCPFNAGATPNLGSQLLDAGRSFLGFAESLPAPGATVCSAGNYARKHVPVGQLQQHPAGLLAAVLVVPAAVIAAGLPRPADGLVRRPQSRQRHARRLGRPRRRMAATEFRRLRRVGEIQQQPADSDLG